MATQSPSADPIRDVTQTAGFRYLTESRLSRRDLEGFSPPAITPAPPFKEYPDAPRLPLPRTWDLVEPRLDRLLQQRRSLRRYDRGPITLEELAFVLWAGQGVTAQAGRYLLRTAPSAGALYPIETYLSIDKVQNVEPGLYHFHVPGFALERLQGGRFHPLFAQACLGQSFMADSAVIFAWTGVLRRNLAKYGHRGMRYVFLDAAHVCAHVLLAAEALAMGGCPVGAFFDEEMEEILDLDPNEETCLYLAALARKPLDQRAVGA